MAGVRSSVVRRIIEVASGPEGPEVLLASVGLPADVEPSTAMRQDVEAETYYDLIERAANEDDHGLPFRYAEVLRAEDFAALGLVMKTASTVQEALQRLARYILVLSDTLEYELRDDGLGGMFVLRGRPHHRRGARLANECALAAITSMLRQITSSSLTPAGVSFRHPRPASTAEHRAFFGCPVRFEARVDALHFTDQTLDTRTRLADEGLSAFLLAQLDQLHQEQQDRSLVLQVHGAVTDSLPDGVPRKAQIARRLGMSERTLHRRLADEGETFQTVADRARREAAEVLLANSEHTLTEVAFLTGFADQSAFQRAFKRWTGQTPRTFRETAVA